jgi:ribosomal protein S18 acetylase RimI-like enzyme
MIIKEATPENAAEIAVLFNAYRVYYEQAPDLPGAEAFIAERLQHRESRIYMALENGRLIGFTQLYPLFTSVGMKRAWVLNDLYVLEEYRKLGAGKALVNAAAEMAKTAGAKWIMLQTHSDNVNAQGLYEKLGFEKDTAYYYYYLGL